ncbi:MAG: hypothetical protein SGPRY_000557 [Prymnesium sp.]
MHAAILLAAAFLTPHRIPCVSSSVTGRRGVQRSVSRFLMQEPPSPKEDHAERRESPEEARQRILAGIGEGYSARDSIGRTPVQEQIQANQREKEEARKRMIAAMGGSSEQLRRGAGIAFGFGGEDEESYGEESDEMDLLTGRPLRGMDLGGDGFDGRQKEWKRVRAAIDPNPPRMANTLRAPGQVPPPRREAPQATPAVLTSQEPLSSAQPRNSVPHNIQTNSVDDEIALLDELERFVERDEN